MWPKHIDLKHKINHPSEDAFWPPLSGHLERSALGPLLWKHREPLRKRSAIYFGTQGGLLEEYNFATPSFSKVIPLLLLFWLKLRKEIISIV